LGSVAQEFEANYWVRPHLKKQEQQTQHRHSKNQQLRLLLWFAKIEGATTSPEQKKLACQVTLGALFQAFSTEH
jgi:hypothetical protein